MSADPTPWRSSLDHPYIRRWLHELADLADRPEIVEHFESALKKVNQSS